MRHLYYYIILIPFLFCHCANPAASGPEASNRDFSVSENTPGPVRTVTGILESTTQKQNPACSQADRVEFYDLEGAVVSTSVEDCVILEVGLTSHKYWGARFLSGNAVVKTLLFKITPGLQFSKYFYVAPGTDAIDLDVIEFEDDFAFPGREPARQNDQDADGISDFIDPDDNGDSLIDDRILDCDGDGIIDFSDC